MIGNDSFAGQIACEFIFYQRDQGMKNYKARIEHGSSYFDVLFQQTDWFSAKSYIEGTYGNKVMWLEEVN